MKTFYFCLGASDPEMNRIEEVIRSKGGNVLYAGVKNSDGILRRVRASEAYSYDNTFLNPDGTRGSIDGLCPALDEVYFVECDRRMQSSACTRCEADPCWSHNEGPLGVIIDHHHPGDSGFGYGPDAYTKGSSLGQVMDLLKVPYEVGDFYLMAADHCLGAAYRGLCWGIDPDELLRRRIAEKAIFTNRSNEQVDMEIIAAVKKLAEIPDLTWGNGKVKVITSHVKELPEAASYLGVAYISEVITKDVLDKKIVMGGCATKEMIEIFMRVMSLAGILGIYGAPERGYAGGTIPNGNGIDSVMVPVDDGSERETPPYTWLTRAHELHGYGCGCTLWGLWPISMTSVGDDIEGCFSVKVV